MSRPALLHSDLDHDPIRCWACEADGEDNAHTSDGPGAGVDRRASVAEVTPDELVCWCGHSLHYPDCPEGGDCHLPARNDWSYLALPAPASCRNRYAAEAAEGERIHAN